MILYDERQLDKAYRIYAKHQGINGVPFISIDNFRQMFEEQQEALLEDLTELFGGFDNDPNY